MENSEAIEQGRMVRPPHLPWRPPCPETERRRFQFFKDLGKNYPGEMAKMKMARIKRKPIVEDSEILRMRRAAMFERRGPITVFIRPGSIRDSSEAACDTKFEAKRYKAYANADPRRQLFKVLNLSTSLPDEVLTACVLKRYREDQSNSSVTVVAASDDVQGTSVIKRHREEIGESSETMVTAADEVLAAASVLKHLDLGEPSETVVPARGNN